tara:strand:+ start:3124 stop:4005 length:882 start_codon:yes stop_codon:yes gene_type:complete
MNKNITAIVPVLNEEKNIEKVLLDLNKFCKNIIVINDGSTDNTSEILEKISLSIPKKLLIITNKKNQGIGYSMKVGLAKALEFSNSIVIKIDGDGQHEPRDIIKFIDKIILENYDFVKGNRFLIKEDLENMPITKLVGNLIVTNLQKIISGHYNISDPNNGFLAMKKSILERIDLESLQNNYFFENSLLLNVTSHHFSVGEVGIKTIYNDEKSSIPLVAASIKLLPTFLKLLFIKNRIGTRYYLSANSVIFFIICSLLFINLFINSLAIWIFMIFLLALYVGIDILNFFSNKN